MAFRSGCVFRPSYAETLNLCEICKRVRVSSPIEIVYTIKKESRFVFLSFSSRQLLSPNVYYEDGREWPMLKSGAKVRFAMNV